MFSHAFRHRSHKAIPIRLSWRWLLHSYLCIALIGSTLFAQLGMTATLVKANGNARMLQQDALLLCTGNGMKWASLSEFQASGKIRYLQVTDEVTHAQSSSVQCPCSHLLDLKPSLLLPNTLLLPFQRLWREAVAPLSARLWRFTLYAVPQCRAPPCF